MTLKSKPTTRSRTTPLPKKAPSARKPKAAGWGLKETARKGSAAASLASAFVRPTSTHERSAPPKRGHLTLLENDSNPPTFEQFGKLESSRREAAIQAGLSADFLDEAIAKIGVSRNDLLAGVGIASSTAARIKQSRKVFSRTDSERLARLARLWHEAYMLYETEQGTRDWLTSDVPDIGGTPLRALATHDGFERAQRTLMQLAYGVLA